LTQIKHKLLGTTLECAYNQCHYEQCHNNSWKGKITATAAVCKPLPCLTRFLVCQQQHSQEGQAMQHAEVPSQDGHSAAKGPAVLHVLQQCVIVYDAAAAGRRNKDNGMGSSSSNNTVPETQEITLMAFEVASLSSVGSLAFERDVSCAAHSWLAASRCDI
jgi:hypothetical protein